MTEDLVSDCTMETQRHRRASGDRSPSTLSSDRRYGGTSGLDNEMLHARLQRALWSRPLPSCGISHHDTYVCASVALTALGLDDLDAATSRLASALEDFALYHDHDPPVDYWKALATFGLAALTATGEGEAS